MTPARRRAPHRWWRPAPGRPPAGRPEGVAGARRRARDDRLGGAEHAGLDRRDRQVAEHRVDLGSPIASGIVWTARTPVVSWAVTAVTTKAPCAPRSATVVRSAASPAAPPESLPAMESTTGRAASSAHLLQQPAHDSRPGRRSASPHPSPRRRARPPPSAARVVARDAAERVAPEGRAHEPVLGTGGP